MVRRMVVRDLSLLSVPSSYSLLLFQERRVFIRTHHMSENGQWLLGPSKKVAILSSQTEKVSRLFQPSGDFPLRGSVMMLGRDRRQRHFWRPPVKRGRWCCSGG